MGHCDCIQAKVLTWDRLVAEALTSTSYQMLAEAMVGGAKAWPGQLSHLRQFRDDLSVMDGVVVYKGRPVIPVAL